MRRFASVFARRDKEPPKSDGPRRANSALVPPPLVPVPSATASSSLPPTPVLSAGSAASSASSTASASLSIQTPEDDPILSSTPTKTKSFTAWLRTKSGTIKRGRPPPTPAAADELWDEPLPEWRPTQPAPVLRAPPPQAGPKSQPPASADSDDEDSSDSESDDDESEPVSLAHPAPTLPPPITPTSEAQSRKYLEILTQNSLATSLGPSPFAHPAGAPLYPRTANSPPSLPVRNSMHAAMHKTLLLRRLHHSDVSMRTVQPLDRFILPFASRPLPTPVDPPSPIPWYNIRAVPATMTITPSSAGLRRWASRRCFEERFAVWVPVNGVVISRPVEGTSAAVAELEYSATLEAMIGFDSPPPEEEEEEPRVADEQPATATTAVKNAQPPAVPSPLRTSSLGDVTSKSTPADTGDTTPPPVATAPTTSRVRFVEDDKEDVIPLGYVLRLKKRREQKAQFLREEQERRVFEGERARQEEERMRRELERRQWEEEKKAWEKEKKAMEEERKKRIYAEEVAAARARREYQRAGGSYGVGNSMLASSSTASLRDERNKPESGKYSRPLHDQHAPRRQASEPAVPQHANTPSGSPHTSSPSSSRPPSIHQTGSIGRNTSRPPSLHSSSEDSRPANHASTGKRGSVASISGKNPAFDRSSAYSMWSGSNPSLMPPVPPVPMYSLDMPLLPPTAPFMLQQSRPRSQDSRNSSPGRSSPSSGSPTRQRQSSNGSTEGVNAQHRQPSSSSRRGSSSSLQRPEMTHQRRGSDDSRRSSLSPRDPQHQYGSMRSQSSSSLARGRPALPASGSPSSFLVSQPPSPWTAPPLKTSYSQQQLSPATAGYASWTLPPTSRRQTTIT